MRSRQRIAVFMTESPRSTTNTVSRINTESMRLTEDEFCEESDRSSECTEEDSTGTYTVLEQDHIPDIRKMVRTTVNKCFICLQF